MTIVPNGTTFQTIPSAISWFMVFGCNPHIFTLAVAPTDTPALRIWTDARLPVIEIDDPAGRLPRDNDNGAFVALCGGPSVIVKLRSLWTNAI